MFKALNNLTKAAISTALAVPAAVVDTAMLIADGENGRDEFSRSKKLLNNAGKCVDKATKPED